MFAFGIEIIELWYLVQIAIFISIVLALCVFFIWKCLRWYWFLKSWWWWFGHIRSIRRPFFISIKVRWSPLWSSQIDYIQQALAWLSQFIPCIDSNLKHMMASWGMWIPSIVFKYSSLGRNLYLFKEFNRILDFHPCLAKELSFWSFGLDVNISHLVGVDLSIVLPKQISDMLAVYFEGWYFNGHLFLYYLLYLSISFWMKTAILGKIPDTS